MRGCGAVSPGHLADLEPAMEENLPGRCHNAVDAPPLNFEDGVAHLRRATK
jgi:hypothetical protein